MPSHNFSALRESRKKDRAVMLQAIIELCHKYKISYEVLPEDPEYRRVSMEIHDVSGLSVLVEFEGRSWQPDVFVLSWYMRVHHASIIRANFAQDRNAHHKSKATQVCYGFAHLRDVMEERLLAISRGEATASHPKDETQTITQHEKHYQIS